MDLTFSEIDDLGNNNYWEQHTASSSQPNPKPKAKFSYDDILSSLNLVVSPTGVLQYMTTNQNQSQNQNQNQNQNQYKNQNQNQNQNQTQYQNQVKQVHPQNKIEPQLKNSTIFNKYFKDYKEDGSVIEEPKKPLTRAEYQQMLIQDYIKRVQEKKRIALVKPKQMMFFK